MEVMSGTRTLNLDQVTYIKNFLGNFPATSLGTNLAWMDLLAPVLAKSDIWKYNITHMRNVTQDPDLCF